ncbi:hypothetical protein [Sphingomonas sp.]|uniref:hypothetical protein n=1 Tax=Sphingomonas sp. TaxID=28214 RepID=UPI001EBB0AC2|nr:hypothetical protein [Sphingomonas sp.]MBX3593672.1 hypothetical protein [Sphingomonas sp.]
MTPDTPIPAVPPRTNALATVATAGLIAFVTGLAVMAAIFRFGGWWQTPAQPAAPLVQPVSAPVAAPMPDTDVPTLAAREQALAARLDALDQRIGQSEGDARVAASYAGRAEAMMLVFGARRAIERGQRLGYIDGELRRRFGDIEPDAVATVTRAAGDPVTLEDLRVAFDQIAPRLSTSSPDDSWFDAIRREVSSLVIVRKEDAPSPHPRERLARAKRLLGQGHVEAALAEVARLPGAQGAESWMAAASRYIETRTALDTLERAAIRGAVRPATGASATSPRPATQQPAAQPPSGQPATAPAPTAR